MTEEEKRISFLNRYFIFKKAHNVNTDKVSKIVAIAEEMEEKAIEKDIKEDEKKSSEDTPKKAKSPRAKKIKNAEKVQLSDFVPIEEEELDKVESKGLLEKEEKGDVKEKEKVPSAKEAKEAKVGDAKVGDAKEKVPRCKDGTKKYKPLGEGCYTDAEIAAHKLNKTKKATDK
jgi:hypothetical protein